MSSGTARFDHPQTEIHKGARSRSGTRVQLHGDPAAASVSTHVQVHAPKEMGQGVASEYQVGNCNVKVHAKPPVENPHADLKIEAGDEDSDKSPA